MARSSAFLRSSTLHSRDGRFEDDALNVHFPHRLDGRDAALPVPLPAPRGGRNAVSPTTAMRRVTAARIESVSQGLPLSEGRSVSEASDSVAVQPASAQFTLLYARLKAMASRQRARAGQPISLCTTEIVHELYLRMSGENRPRFAHELEFFSYAARAMRHVLIDLARRRLSLKEGGDLIRVDVGDPAVGAVAIEPARALELDAAIRLLEQDAPRAAQVLELHYFAGLPLERVAELTGIAPRTVDRDWRYARSFLAVQIGG